MKTVIGMYRHNPKTEESVLLQTLDMEEPLKSLLRRKAWKSEVEQLVMEKGFRVLSVSVVHGGSDGIHIAVSVTQQPQEFGRRVATTRGGKPMTGPVATSKTMAAKRRAARTPR